MIVTAGTGNAQTWHWKHVTRIANGPSIVADSTVVLSPNEVSTSYTAPIGDRETVIASCHAALSDVQKAMAVRIQGRPYLLIQLKPQRAADCESGKEPGAALPADDFGFINRVAEAINRGCCAVAAASPASSAPRTNPKPATATPSPAAKRVAAIASPTPAARPVTPSPSPTPTARPVTPSSTPTPSPALVRLADWVQSDGLFVFVRVRNTGKRAVTITGGEVLDCRNVDVGCGPLGRRYTLDPAGTATIATVASADQQKIPSFSYRYSAVSGERTISSGGSSAKAPPKRFSRMSARDVRVAEAAAIGGLRTTGSSQQSVSNYSPPRLLTRGSSRLAIGETGSAQVRVLVTPSGAPEEATIVTTSNRSLVAAAIETAISSTYAPAMKNGRPVAANYVATFSFNGEDPATASIPVWRRAPMPTARAMPAPPSVTPSPIPSPPRPATPPQ